MKKDQRTDYSENEMTRILAAKARGRQLFAEDERGVIAARQQKVVDRLWQERLKKLSHLSHPLAELKRSPLPPESLAKIVAAGRPRSDTGCTRSRAGAAAGSIIQGRETLFGCEAHLVSPPFSNGFPLEETAGNSAVSPVINGDFVVSSALSLPGEGSLSLGVGVGSYVGDTVHLPTGGTGDSDLQPQEWNTARASIGYFLDLSGAEAGKHAQMTVTADLTVGTPQRPFYILEVGDGPTWSAVVLGVAYLTTYIDGRAEPLVRDEEFLFDWQGSSGPLLAVNLLREFNLTDTMTAGPDVRYVYVEIEVRIQAIRYYFGGTAEERNGFAMIDLRSPAATTHPVHFALAPGGPIRVRNVGISLCEERVAAGRVTIG